MGTALNEEFRYAEYKRMAYILTDNDKVVYANECFLTLSGYEESDLLGKNLADVWNGLLKISTPFEDMNALPSKQGCFISHKTSEKKEVNIFINYLSKGNHKVFAFEHNKASNISTNCPVERVC